jgi:hypothetical protein
MHDEQQGPTATAAADGDPLLKAAKCHSLAAIHSSNNRCKQRLGIPAPPNCLATLP